MQTTDQTKGQTPGTDQEINLEGTAFTLVRIAPNRYRLTEGGQSIIIQATTLFELSGFIQDREDIEVIIEDAELGSAPLTPEQTTIYQHLLKFRRGIDATRAEPVVSGLIQVTRIRTGEFDWPVVIFETDYPLLDETCTRLARLANVSAKFNSLVTSGHVEDEPLTPEQERLYERLKANDGFAGNAAQLATFADLPYPFDPNIVHTLVERGLIEHHAIDRYWLTVTK